jgi:hypothetical protein
VADEADLIAVIYDAIIDPSRWDEVVKRVVEDTKSFGGNLVLQQPDAGSLTALYNVDPLVAAAYAHNLPQNRPPQYAGVENRSGRGAGLHLHPDRSFQSLGLLP